MHELMRRLRQDERFTIMFISHEVPVVYQYATDVVCLSHQRAHERLAHLGDASQAALEVWFSPRGFWLWRSIRAGSWGRGGCLSRQCYTSSRGERYDVTKDGLVVGAALHDYRGIINGIAQRYERTEAGTD